MLLHAPLHTLHTFSLIKPVTLTLKKDAAKLYKLQLFRAHNVTPTSTNMSKSLLILALGLAAVAYAAPVQMINDQTFVDKINNKTGHLLLSLPFWLKGC